jgi:hypothetical protein
MNYLSNEYIASVASKPYSKAPEQRRPIEYTTSKLLDLLAWREESGATEVFELLEVSKMPPGEEGVDPFM